MHNACRSGGTLFSAAVLCDLKSAGWQSPRRKVLCIANHFGSQSPRPKVLWIAKSFAVRILHRRCGMDLAFRPPDGPMGGSSRPPGWPDAGRCGTMRDAGDRPNGGPVLGTDPACPRSLAGVLCITKNFAVRIVHAGMRYGSCIRKVHCIAKSFGSQMVQSCTIQSCTIQSCTIRSCTISFCIIQSCPEEIFPMVARPFVSGFHFMVRHRFVSGPEFRKISLGVPPSPRYTTLVG